MVGNVCDPRLHTAPVFLPVRAHHLDVERRDTGLPGDSAPMIARERPWIHTVSDDCVPQTQIVFRDRICDGVALAFDCHPTAAKRLLDGINPQVDGLQGATQLRSNRGLPNAWKSTQDDEL